MKKQWPKVFSAEELKGMRCPSCNYPLDPPCTFACIQCGFNGGDGFEFTPTENRKELLERLKFVIRAYCL